MMYDKHRYYVPFQSSELGSLEMIDVLCYYDGPRMFTCADSSGNLYLVTFIDEFENGDVVIGDEWLVVGITPTCLVDVKNGRMDLHDAFRYADSGHGLLIKSYYDKSLDCETRVRLDTLDDDYFCKPGVRLGCQQ